LENKEILDIQIGKFRNELNEAIAQKYEKVVFIHGIGAGTLKMEIRNILQKEFKKYQFQDASFREYGYGATMVLLK